jgi:hypothetical protein
MNTNLKVILMIPTLNQIFFSNIKFIWNFLSSIFEITIDLANFFEKIKININELIKKFSGKFPPFCKHKKGPSTSLKDF